MTKKQPPAHWAPASIDKIVKTKSFHPAGVSSFFPACAFWPKDLGNKSIYAGLTDKSHYREYAWEFLRRNRFFQHELQQREAGVRQTISDEQWCPNRFESVPSCGLSNTPHYRDKYSVRDADGKQLSSVQWYVVDEIVEQFRALAAPGPPRRTNSRSSINDGMISVTFNINPLHGDVPAIDLQISMVREQLRRLALKGERVTERGLAYKRPNKNMLRNLLRVIDLYSMREDRTLRSVAAKFDEFESKQRAPTESSLSDEEREAKRDKAEKRVSALAIEAFKYVYKGKYLRLLAVDPWPWLAPKSKQGKLSNAITPESSAPAKNAETL